MQQKALTFPKGAMFRIVCRANEYALTIEDRANHKNSRIIGMFQDPEDIAQLWFIQQIKNADFEIVNALSSFCFDEEKGQIRLKKGKQKNDQLFSVEKVPEEAYHTWFWIKTQAHGDKAVCLEGTLKYTKFDPKNENQMFRFEPFIANSEMDKTSIITNTVSGKVIDVPEASRKEGERIIQYSKNRRFNQRWVFENAEGGTLIRNFHSGLVLDVEGQHKKPGTPIIQWSQNNGSNQLWRFEERGNNTFVIRSVMQPKLMLGVLQNSVEDMGKLVITKDVTTWHVEGRLPPYQM